MLLKKKDSRTYSCLFRDARHWVGIYDLLFFIKLKMCVRGKAFRKYVFKKRWRYWCKLPFNLALFITFMRLKKHHCYWFGLKRLMDTPHKSKDITLYFYLEKPAKCCGPKKPTVKQNWIFNLDEFSFFESQPFHAWKNTGAAPLI